MDEETNSSHLKRMIRLCFMHNNSSNQILGMLVNEYPNINEFQELRKNMKIVNAALLEINEMLSKGQVPNVEDP